jgi:phasin family protein
MAEELAAFNKGNLEAMVESSKIIARGFESLGQDVAAFAKSQLEQSTAMMKTLASVKSPTEFMKVQSDMIRQSFDQMVAQSSRSTETMLKLAGKVAQPISNRMAVAADKMKLVAA